MRLRFSALAIVVLGCAVGTTSANYQPARGPAGAAVTIAAQGGTIVLGELLAVESQTLLVREDRRLVRVAFDRIESLRAPKINLKGSGLAPADERRLRLISRYPQGVSPELERQLLAAYGQDAVLNAP